MYLKKLNITEVREIYIKHMKIDFPAGELKPIDAIENLIKRERYICYGLYKENDLLAYAFLTMSEKSYLLIDYFAVCLEHRNKGIGSDFLKLLKEQWINYSGILVEVEKVECASNEKEKIIRQRRIDFYRRNGFWMTNVLSTLFCVKYSIMCLSNETLEDYVVYNQLCKIYKEIVPSALYKENVKVIINEE